MNIPILLLHGALGSARSFRKIQEALGENASVTSLEFSGHGSNAALPDRLSTKVFADDVLGWMNNNKVEKVSVIGHSLGGYVGLYLAAHHPEKIERVFTFGTKMNWTPEFSRKETAMLDPSKIESGNPKLAEYLSATHKEWQALTQKVADYMTDLGNAPSVTPELLAGIKCPVRMSVGDRDHMVTMEETLQSYKHLPKGQLQVFPGTVHAVERLSPEYMAQAWRDFSASPSV